MKIFQLGQVTRTLVGVILLSAMVPGVFQSTLVTAADSPTTQSVAAQASTEIPNATDILQGMARYLADAPTFSVNVASDFDVLQASGQKIEFGDARNITVSRPDGLRVEQQESNGNRHTLVYDGKDITMFSADDNVYAQAPVAGGIDEAVRYFLMDLNMRLPLAVLLVSQLPDELARRTESLDYVEETTLYNHRAHHLAGRTATVDYQIWIAQGAQPLPIRIVLTYRNADGQPQFRARFADWNLKPQITKDQFRFSPPAGARRIAFEAQFPTAASETNAQPTNTGEQP
jgi:hypothetical protein